MTRVLRPSPKRCSERERFKGELGGARRGLAAKQQLIGRLAGVRRLCASELPGNGMSLSVASRRLQAKFLKL